MGKVILDASVLIGFLDKRDTHNERATAAVVRLHETGETPVVPASVLSETLVSAARYGTNDIDRVRELLRRLFGPCRHIDEDIAVTAAQLRATHRSLRLPDALVIATGVVDDAKTILTADKRWKGVDERIQLLDENPD